MNEKDSDHVVVEVEESKTVSKDSHFDEDLLHRAIADTGRWAYGTGKLRCSIARG